MSEGRRILKILLPLLFLGAGALGMILMIQGRQAPVRQETPFAGILVETVAVQKAEHQVVLHATGTVQARQEVEIVPQVNGRVVAVSPKLVSGGFFAKGEELFEIETIDFELAVERARATLHRAELDLRTVQAQAEIGRDEWQRLHPGEEPDPLVVFEPQLKNAEAALAAARAALRQAELDLQRTRVTAPFNGLIRDEQIDVGQYLKSGNRVATLTGTDQVEIVLPLRLDDLQWLDVPRQPGRKGSPAAIILSTESGQWQWTGWLSRSLGAVDTRGRMVRVAVLVDDPYGLHGRRSGEQVLPIGSFVEVRLQGQRIPGVVALPRTALRERDTVWIMNAEDRLEIVTVDVLRRERESVLLQGGLNGGENVILTPISGAADGLLLRTQEN